MTYSVDPNAKNVWIRDNADTMDLSVQTEAHAVYLENGRTLEQEVGKGTMVSNVVTVDGSMEKVVEGTYDGVYESCKMYGRSLVNLMTNCKDEYVVRYHNPSNPNHTVANISMMKPNTEYTLFYKAKYRLEGDGAGESGALNIATSIEQGFINTSQKLTTEYQQYVFKFTTTSIVDCFTFKSNGNYFAIKECVLLEGDYTNQDVPFFEGLCDVKMPILKSTGKNLIENLPRLSANGISIQPTNNPTQVVVNGTATDITDYYVAEVKMNNNSHIFNIEVGESLTLSNSLGKKCYFGQDKNGITEWTSPSLTKKDGGTNLRCFIRFNQGDSFDNETMTVQIEQGLTATEFEPYKTSILTTSEEVILRKVGDVCDSYDALTGECIRRIGEVVLDGSQQISLDGDLFYIFIDEPCDNVLTISDTLPSVTVGDIIRGVEGVGIQNRGGGSRLYININGLSTKEEISQRLQNTPTPVQYKLATPTMTIIEPSTIPFVYENGHVILESGYEGQSLLPTLEYSTVINRTGQIQSIANTVQKQEKQITKLEKMLIQNIVNLDYNNTLLTLNLEINEVI